jgi:ABC-type amino acid transport substrate-binding protein
MKKRIIIISLLLLLFSSVLMGCSGNSDISYQIVEKSGFFTVGYDAQSYHTYDGYGLAINIIKLAAQRMGLEAPIRPVNDYDWEAVLYNEDIDMMLCKTSDENLMTTAVFNDNIVMVSATDREIVNVGVIDSDACIEQKNAYGQNEYDYTYYSDSNLLLNDLSIGTVDAVIMSEYDALPYTGITEFDVQELSSSPIYFVVHNQKQSFYEKLNQTLEQMVSDGTIARLKQEYIQSLS